jgi:hypothetical protein
LGAGGSAISVKNKVIEVRLVEDAELTLTQRLARFETVPKSIRNKIKKINDMAVLKLLLKNAITAGSVKEFNKIMDTAIV